MGGKGPCALGEVWTHQWKGLAAKDELSEKIMRHRTVSEAETDSRSAGLSCLVAAGGKILHPFHFYSSNDAAHSPKSSETEGGR